MIHGVPDHAPGCCFDIVDMKIMNDDIPHKLDGETSAISNVDIDTAPVDCFVTLHDQFLRKGNCHASSKYDPQWPFLDHSMPEGAWSWLSHIIVRGISNHVDWATLATLGSAAETLGTICQPLPVISPVGVASPAFVNHVGGHAWPSVSPSPELSSDGGIQWHQVMKPV